MVQPARVLARWAVAPASWALLAVLGTAQPVRGQAVSPHYQTLLVGDRSMGMGTAFTGLANDGSAVYYNPGGLVNRERATITGGFWLTAFDRKVLVDGARRDFGDFDLNSRSNPVYPAFVASTINLGKRSEDGLRPYVLALSSFQVRRDQFLSTTDMLDPVTQTTDTFEVRHEERDVYIGLTLARRFERVLGAGLSLFLVQRRYSHRENAFIVSGEEPFDIDQSRGVSAQNSVSNRSYLLVARAGLLKRIRPRWDLGITLQLPGIPLKSRASWRFQRLRYDLEGAPGTADYFIETSDDLRSRSPIPPELRVGVAQRVNDRFTWTGDLSLVVPLLDREVIEGQQQRVRAGEVGAFVVPTTKGVPVVNVALGCEARLSRLFLGQLGVFTDFSSAPRVPAFAAGYQAPRVHEVGVTASIAARGNDRGMAVGISGVIGRGKGLGAVLGDDGVSLAYGRTDVRSRTIFISLTGAIESAERLARAAAAKVAPGTVEGGELDVPERDPSTPEAAPDDAQAPAAP